MTALTTLGSLFSTLLATPLAPILTRLFPRPIELTRAALEGSSLSSASAESQPFQPPNPNLTASPSPPSPGNTPAWVRLTVLRLVGVVPWSALNVACGITGVSMRDCAAGAFIGTLPWTAVTCQIGNILHTVGAVRASGAADGMDKSATLSSVLASPHILVELVVLSVLSLAPILARERLRKLISPSETSEGGGAVELRETVNLNDDDADDDDDVDVDGNGDKEVAELDEDDVEFEKYGRRGRRVRRERQRWTWKRLSMSVPRWSMLQSQAQAQQALRKSARDRSQ